MTADTTEKWRDYGQTILDFGIPPRPRVDLREPIDHATLVDLKRLGLERPFAVFTAENPRGENSEDAPSPAEEETREERNARRESRLEQELRRRGTAFVPVDGSAPDGSYREHCVAALMSREEAIAFARALDQLALFWFDGRSFWQLPAEADAEPTRLPAPAA
jgi:hypothetical protein